MCPSTSPHYLHSSLPQKSSQPSGASPAAAAGQPSKPWAPAAPTTPTGMCALTLVVLDHVN